MKTNDVMKLEFRSLPINNHFRFSNKKHEQGVGVKLSKYIYRMNGLNRVIGSIRVSVIPTLEELD